MKYLGFVTEWTQIILTETDMLAMHNDSRLRYLSHIRGA
jgi:hypothetical protein